MVSVSESPKVLIMGCGGLGGIIAAHLTARGQCVYPVSRNPDIVAAVARRGFVVRGGAAPLAVPGRVYSEIPGDVGPFDFAVLASQPVDCERAAQQVDPHLASNGRIVCLPNGLCEERIAQALGNARKVVGAIVAWGASAVEPGIYDRTSGGGFVLGPYDSDSDPTLDTLAALLECVGPVARTANLTGARWSKLAINCAVSSLGTIAGERLGPLLRQRFIRRLALEIITEAVRVAQGEGVRLEKISGTLDLTSLALQQTERQAAASMGLASKHAMMLAVGLRYRRLRSSMLSAIERGRIPPVDFLNGEIVDRGERLGVAVPVNAAVVELVWRLYRRELTPDRQHLRELYDRSRAIAIA